jgi:two-component system cell cycle sensor histidine kinase PleC
MGSAQYRQRLSPSHPAAEEALRTYAAGRSSFDYGLARELEMLIAALRSAHDEAKAANQAKSEFLACVSHELRTPLNTILGFAEMIAGEQLGPIPERRYADYASDIVKGARHLSEILGDIIDMARLEAGRLRSQRDAFSFADLVEEVRAVCGERKRTDAAALIFDIPPEFPDSIWTDKARLRQILVNLLSNALDFTPREGTVTLSARRVPSGNFEIRVADTGRGMSPAEMKRAVTRFGHVESEASRARPGIGLGLPLAKGLTELLGGALRLESTPHEGTTVTLTFPIYAFQTGPVSWGKPADRMSERAQRLLAESGEFLSK